MFHGACPVKSYCLTQSGKNMKSFASHNQMRLGLDLTCLQASSKATRSVYESYNALETQVALPKYPPETAKILHRDIFWISSKMKSLSPRQSMIVIQTWTGFPQARSGSLQRRWRVQR